MFFFVFHVTKPLSTLLALTPLVRSRIHASFRILLFTQSYNHSLNFFSVTIS